MSTRSNIGIMNDNGTVTYVYCHHDGYVDGVGATLHKYWNSEERARELIAGGDMSSIWGDNAEYYHRDRGEDFEPNKSQTSTLKEVVEGAWPVIEYIYIWKNDHWIVAAQPNGEWEKLEDVLAKPVEL